MISASLPLVIALASMTNAAIHTVQVGHGALSFSPSSITAAKGDRVEFIFASDDHSVTQGDFSNPCQPLNSRSFDSGIVNSDSPPWVITVNNTDPIYFYCETPGHCQSGMAGAINAPSSKSADDYISASEKSSSSGMQSQVQGGTFGTPSTSPSQTSSSSAPSSAATSPSSTPSPGAASSLSSMKAAAIGAVLFPVVLNFAL